MPPPWKSGRWCWAMIWGQCPASLVTISQGVPQGCCIVIVGKPPSRLALSFLGLGGLWQILSFRAWFGDGWKPSGTILGKINIRVPRVPGFWLIAIWLQIGLFEGEPLWPEPPLLRRYTLIHHPNSKILSRQRRSKWVARMRPWNWNGSELPDSPGMTFQDLPIRRLLA